MIFMIFSSYHIFPPSNSVESSRLLSQGNRKKEDEMVENEVKSYYVFIDLIYILYGGGIRLKLKKRLKLNKIGVAMLTAGVICTAYMPLHKLQKPVVALAAENQSDSLERAFAQASKEFGVPASLLKAISYNKSRWESHNGKPSAAGGYGLMHLTDIPSLEDGKGNGAVPSKPAYDKQQTLSLAAKLLNSDKERLKKDPVQNIRGGAAVLAFIAKDKNGNIPSTDQKWYDAVAAYGASQDKKNAQVFADDVYETLEKGAEHTTSDGQHLKISPQNIDKSIPRAENSNTNKADCPASLKCEYIPAFYGKFSESPSDYGNYDIANRQKSDVRYIVIHDTEVSYDGTIDLFANPNRAAANYVIRSSDGHIAQMIHNKDVAWHAGNWYFNTHSIGIEHEGFALEGSTWFTEEMYRSSARLVRHLAKEYNIPLDRAHIIGHDEVPGLSPKAQSGMHSDPGPFWDWGHYMDLVGSPVERQHTNKLAVTINPVFQNNQPEVSDAPKQPANFVYLHQAPSNDSPLLNEPAASGPGTKQTLDWGSKAVTGQTYAVAETKGEWTAIWYGGQKAWFYNPHNKNTSKGTGILLTPKPGKESIQVYGGAFPEASAYPSDIPVKAMVPLQYKISPDQVYVGVEKVRSDYYYAPTFTTNPNDHKMIVGKDEYYQIYFNHRYAFVKASDVEVKRQ